MLEAVILESLRLLPPAYLVGRCATASIELCGYRVPEGEHKTVPLSSTSDPCTKPNYFLPGAVTDNILKDCI